MKNSGSRGDWTHGPHLSFGVALPPDSIKPPFGHRSTTECASRPLTIHATTALPRRHEAPLAGMLMACTVMPAHSQGELHPGPWEALMHGGGRFPPK